MLRHLGVYVCPPPPHPLVHPGWGGLRPHEEEYNGKLPFDRVKAAHRIGS